MVNTDFGFKCRHCGDHRAENPVSGKQIPVGYACERSAHVRAERLKKSVCQFHAACFVSETGLASIRGVRFAPDMTGIDHAID
jgi:hypothetical protein